MGIVPIWGFQMMAAIALAILFRLNKGLVLIAANISFPPFIPVILYLSHLTGKVWMGDKGVDLSFSRGFDLVTIHASFLQYILGAITLAAASGLFFGLVTFLLLNISSRIKKDG